ncbi:MAG: carboxypeptidase-like regulatory domain-containing protein, partial [Eudoraea sp.]
MKRLLLFFLLLTPLFIWSQTKAGGIVVDEEGDPVAFANVIFKGSTEGAITNEDGLFYLESSKEYNSLII